MKSLVAGAAGFIGSSVVRAILADGDEVRAMVYPGEDLKNIDDLDLEVIEGDIMDRASLDRAMRCPARAIPAWPFISWRRIRRPTCSARRSGWWSFHAVQDHQ